MKFIFLKIQYISTMNCGQLRKRDEGRQRERRKKEEILENTGHTYLTVMRKKFQEQKDVETKRLSEREQESKIVRKRGDYPKSN